MKTETQDKVQGYTPGPWAVNAEQDQIIGPRGNVVAYTCGYSVKATDPNQRRQGGREANARLISAAPDMLAALQEIVAEWDNQDSDDPRMNGTDYQDTGGIVLARTAIAKATQGGQS